MDDLLRALEAEIVRFRQWADATPVPDEERNGEWACAYGGWAQIYRAFDAFVAASPCQGWNEATTELVLYAIARDNDIMHLVRTMAKRPDDLVCLAERAIASPEYDAKWQIARELGHLGPGLPHVERLLLDFAHDTNEDVRRCAQLALLEIDSASLEPLLEPAWNAGSEYQRVTILYIFWKMGSPKLEHYLSLAEADPTQCVRDYVERVRAGNPT